MHPQTLSLTIRGHVQGVGFRPSAYRLATALGLHGWVQNDPDGARLLLFGPPNAIATFQAQLPASLPPPAAITTLESHPRPTPSPPPSSFSIRPSIPRGTPTARILPDLATCPDCLAETLSPTSRRYLYPFTNCTHCGPRYSIIASLPYDRPNTVMRAFPMCPDCRAEYLNPADRRFHAQPIACPRCGPHLRWLNSAGHDLLPPPPPPHTRAASPAAADAATATTTATLRAATAALQAGAIVALKGIGGFHLLADARSPAAIQRLRLRKNRPAKPFAVMFPSLPSLAQHCLLPPGAPALLRSPAAPILLLPRRPSSTLPEIIAPRLSTLGAFLPYSPLHHLLLRSLHAPIIATSGNLTNEPICIDNDEALARLASIADFFLLHDRPILRPMDDSIVMLHRGRPIALRRARGLAPYAFPLPSAPHGLLAAGADLKATIALVSHGEATISQHLGTLPSAPSPNPWHRALRDLVSLRATPPRRLAVDLHPHFLSTRAARSLHLPTTPIQHHHAHAAACLAENALPGPALVLAWDGTGLGPNGQIWGGEILSSTPAHSTRLAHLLPFPLIGGDAAIREPRRLAYALSSLASPSTPCPLPFTPTEIATFRTMIASHLNTPPCTSMGRLFDAVSALLGLCPIADYEGQPAMLLQAAAQKNPPPTPPPYPYAFLPSPNAPDLIDWRPLLRAILRHPAPIPLAAARFHATLAAIALTAAQHYALPNVCLTGGCFQNPLLLELVQSRLETAGYRVYLHHHLPPNDAGLPLGQLAAAAALIPP